MASDMTESNGDAVNSESADEGDLREELYQGLASKFEDELKNAEGLPDAAREGLIALLEEEIVTSKSIIDALCQNDEPEQEEQADD